MTTRHDYWPWGKLIILSLEAKAMWDYIFIWCFSQKPLKQLLNKTLLELLPFKIISKNLSVYPRYKKFLLRSWSYKKQVLHEQFLVLIGWIFKNLHLWSGTKVLMICEFVPINAFYKKKIPSLCFFQQKTWLPCTIIDSDWLKLLKSFPMKLKVDMVCFYK